MCGIGRGAWWWIELLDYKVSVALLYTRWNWWLCVCVCVCVCVCAYVCVCVCEHVNITTMYTLKSTIWRVAQAMQRL